MAEEEKKEEPEFISKEEMLRMLLVEDEQFKDEGRDDYLDEVIGMIRKDLGIDGEDKGSEKSEDGKSEQ